MPQMTARIRRIERCTAQATSAAAILAASSAEAMTYGGLGRRRPSAAPARSADAGIAAIVRTRRGRATAHPTQRTRRAPRTQRPQTPTGERNYLRVLGGLCVETSETAAESAAPLHLLRWNSCVVILQRA